VTRPTDIAQPANGRIEPNSPETGARNLDGRDPGVMPPPLPLPTARPRTSFVTVLAWISLPVAGLGVAYGVIQLLMGLLMPADTQLRMLSPAGGALPALPPMMAWVYANTALMGGLTLLSSAAFLVASWGLLKRRESGRRGFIAVLVLGTLWQWAWVWVVPQIIQATLALQSSALNTGQDMPMQLEEGLVTLITAMVALMVLLFTGLHAWIVWKLCTTSVRAEFGR